MLLGKPKDKFEVYNDLDDELVNLFRCVRDRPAEFLLELGLLPLNSRTEFGEWLKFHTGRRDPALFLPMQDVILDNLLPMQEWAEQMKKALHDRADYKEVLQAAAFFKRMRNSYASSGRSFACQPFSVRTTFRQMEETSDRLSKVVNTTMPQIDYVINLCNGLKDIPVLGAVPAVCAFDALPCIPNNAKTIMIGEDKRISNHLATLSGINIPRETSIESDNGIIRPISFGSSIGVMKTPVPRPTYDYICQEFIEGYDVTVPIMYNPLYEDFEVLPGVLYLPCHADPEWFLGEEEKQLHTAYEKVGIEIPVSIQKNLLSLAKLFQVDTYCRVDTRIRTSEILSRDRIPSFSFELKDLYFLEINTMPTIKEGINFHTSIVNMGTRNRMSAAFDLFKEHVKNPSITGFILASSILALSSKATH